ncbi:lamin tail domain-containing protein [Luteolibacter pohnpeiensis]|uniref:Lamin tail domain-containing protein n=1 Tax=Luteolibacter pohnpeiensis TaxID=454153 RepID=A0A934S351_9BACT|nr:lamin tail domain-containing protein [Luteolibacter pohnpeiensis]MBK1882295.1 lamin tail domain-containing protein [Luteolibacter pohnpeiensis]
MRVTFFSLFVGICSIAFAAAEPVISEFMADNESTIADEDGDFSDWIEIHNPTSDPISLANWSLTDKPGNLTQWKFPAVTLQPGEFLVVWASGKNRRSVSGPLHTNFALSKDGEFLALVRPDGSTAQSFDPEFPALAEDESFGLRFESTALLSETALGRYRAPASATDPGDGWNQPSFSDSSWTSGQSGFGFGITVPGITVRQISKNGSVTGLTDALNLITLSEDDPLVLAATSKVYDWVNFLGEGAEGNYAFNEVPPGGGGENYVLEATGFVTIPTAGTYTFGLNSDDGGRILIDGTEIMRDDSFHGPTDHFGTISLTAGEHSFQVVMFEGNSGDCLEFFAASGARSTFDASVFHLVGDVASGGLAASTNPPGTGGLIGTDLSRVMASRPSVYLRMPFTAPVAENATVMSLVMRYNDGFAAWLDGAKVATANAPASPAWNSVATASRTNPASLRAQGFNLTSSLSTLHSGSHLLAIQGLKSSSADTSFLALPEVIVGNLNSGLDPVKYGGGLATPGWINGTPSSLGTVADTQFSVDRGFFSSPFSVEITSATPGAIIRYTTDGSEPSETNGLTYAEPIQISSTTVLRAQATLDGWEPTNIDTQTYLFLDDVLGQSADGSAPPGWPASSGTSQVLDFGMDPEIVNNRDPEIGGPEEIKAALLALPTVSITTDLGNLLNIDGSQGIYSNPGSRGFAWERPVSMEWIDPPDDSHPNGKGEFQINAGVRIRGGSSRDTNNPKHAFRFFFRDDYGDTKLRYPLFGADAAQEFDKIDLRTAQNYSWSYGGDSRNTFLREESSRQALLDMGQPGSHVRYVHLYLNGQYWGLYNLDERTEAAFSESYFGGDKEEYDVVKAEQETDYTVGATDGSLDAWRQLWDESKAHRASPTNANYFKMMGLAADGVTPTDDPVLLDDGNLIDYLLLTFWTGNLDGSVSYFLGSDKSNNWFGSRRRENNPGQGFQFFVHDFEHTMLDVNEDRTGPFPSANESNFAYSSPMFLHQDLIGNAEYRLRWADHVQKFMFNNGALTGNAWQNRISKLAESVDGSIAAESARWGDAKRDTPYTRVDWMNARDQLVALTSQRNQVVLNQLRADGLYPSIDAPILSPFGGHQPTGVQVSVQGPTGATVYYMPDGSDPREIGGAVKSGARVYSSTTTQADLIPWSASGWKFLGDGSDLGTAWREPEYDDALWSTGKAELGYGDGDESTLVPIVDVDPSTGGVQKAATCYFRRDFNLSNKNEITSLTLSVEYDDAYAVYLNGTRIAGNLPQNPAYDYYSGNVIEDTIETTTLTAASLREGTNTLAVEIHQSVPDSSDLSMNLQLNAVRSTTSTPLILSEVGPVTLRFRAKSGDTWSALAESTYQIGAALPVAGELVVSEIFYHPQDPNGDAEFLELMNVGSNALDVSGARFTEGIDYTFPDGTVIDVGQRVLLVRSLAAFEALFGSGKPVFGEFANDTALSNSGERLKLESVDGNTLLDFTYGTAFPWPESADGSGTSLVLLDQMNPDDPRSWRASAVADGTPGGTDSIALAPGQDLLDYALMDRPALDPASGQFSVKRKLGADDASVTAEWSSDLVNWSAESISLISEIPDGEGNSTLTWQLDPLPPGKAFFRLRVDENR